MTTAALASDNSATKTAVLDAAERLFAARGFNATSIRAITEEAQANLGAVNYHFDSKDALILAVLRRRIQPLNAERFALLERFEEEARGKPLRIEKILEALFRPAIDLIAKPKRGGEILIRLIAQCLAEPGAFLRPLIEEEFAEKNRRFHAAIQRALPFLTSEEVHWRLHFAHGVFLHTIANAHVLELASERRCRVNDLEKTLGKMITFCAAGFAVREGKTGKANNGNFGTNRTTRPRR